ncbi:Sec34-like family-domain-containing protein [Chaetomidium leptoderma]|uniref:Conserved oligomeric Golgi complex subunit 3 n=1 Tax=Chaetomidium leptoderma TaxID=669021 RepID=A0AAN6VMM4_9PEZI|nr:Sec34-like family-domain-containing protein [Chaetomidium leptoderma]
MYEDSWYSFVPEFQQRQPAPGTQSTGHRRKQSLLQQPNGNTDQGDAIEPLPALFEDQEDAHSPPEPTLSRRAKSYSDFYDIVKAQLSSHGPKKSRRRMRRRQSGRGWEALAVPESVTARLPGEEEEGYDDALDKELLRASQQEYLLYHDELAMTERHLGSLIADADSALTVLESLCQSFRAVDGQTSSFQAQCDGLLTEQRRLETLADSVGTDLQYYLYLDSATRRLNAPGAGRLVEGGSFVEILSTLDSCIEFMTRNSSYRDAESYLARYEALLTKALHLLEVGFVNHLNKVSAEISRQIAATQSESARHALAYGRFEEMVLESYSLIPNMQAAVQSAYDQDGQPSLAPNSDTYANTANNMFHSYWAARERDLKPITQHDVDAFRAEAKESVEPAARNFVKQCFERSHNEASLFRAIFSIDAHYSTDPRSAFVLLKSQRAVLTGANVVPIATNLQTALQTGDLQTTCNLVGWITNEYLLPEYDEDETAFVGRCRELAARLLAEHLWAFTDAFFEAEIAKSISRAVVSPEALKIGPVTNDDVASNAFPPVKRALELLAMFDQSMPKERCQRDSPVIFKIIKESIAALQRAEGRIKSTKPAGGGTGTDPDLFLIKNLLILKNELMTLEIGDVRSNPAAGGGGGGGGAVSFLADALRPQNMLGGLLSSFGSLSTYIPGSSLWSSRSGANTPASGGTPALGGGAAAAQVDDASEQLDGLLRQSIYGFTKRWAGVLNEARGVGGGNNKLGGRNVGKVERELEEMLERAFSGQPEVVGKLKEAIQIEAQAQVQALGEKRSHVTKV